jgi:hypothetical protein
MSSTTRKRPTLLIVARLYWAVALFSSAFVSRSVAQPPSPGRPPSAGGNAQAASQFSGAGLLEKVWPGHPESLAMLADIIIKGDHLQGGDGWFRHDRSHTRFGWQAARAAWDKDGNASVSRAEFPGTDSDFARLDRVRDAALSPSDFDFSTGSSNFMPGSSVFGRTDRDGNGRVTREELDAFFRNADSDGVGFLSLADLQQALDAPPPLLRGTPGGPNGPTRGTLLKSFFRGEFGGMVPGPALNEIAPDFTLKTADGEREVELSKIVGPKPVVLVFGNYTCRPFRGQGGNLEKLYARFKDRATFLAVYTREAHPTDGWRMEVNDSLGVSIPQPTTYAERAGVAQVCARTLGLSFPLLVDTLDDSVNKRYCGIPSRLYLIDADRKIAFKSGRGPFGFRPSELEQSLVMLLQRLPQSARSSLATSPRLD